MTPSYTTERKLALSGGVWWGVCLYMGSKAQPYEIARSKPADLMLFDRIAREIQDFSAEY